MHIFIVDSSFFSLTFKIFSYIKKFAFVVELQIISPFIYITYFFPIDISNLHEDMFNIFPHTILKNIVSYILLYKFYPIFIFKILNL